MLVNKIYDKPQIFLWFFTNESIRGPSKVFPPYLEEKSYVFLSVEYYIDFILLIKTATEKEMFDILILLYYILRFFVNKPIKGGFLLVVSTLTIEWWLL